MGVLTEIFAAERTDLENPALWLLDSFGGAGKKSAAGETVTPSNALTSSAWYAIVHNPAQDVASLPLQVLRKRAGGRRRERVPDHPLEELLDGDGSFGMLGPVLRETMTAFARGWRAGYAEIVRDVAGRVAGFLLIHPSRVRVVLKNGQKYFEVHYDDLAGPGKFGDVTILPDDRVLHFHGPGNGYDGYSIAQLAAEGLGLAKAQELYAASFFGNGTHIGGILEVPGKPQDDTVLELKRQWREAHSLATRKAHDIAVLTNGMKFQTTATNPEDAQFIEGRKFQVVDLARYGRVPPHIIQDLERATNNNIEHQGIEYVVYCLQWMLRRWEKEIRKKCFTAEERAQGYYVKHVLQALVRGDFKTRTEAYAQMRQNSILSANDVRELEDLNPIDSPGGDDYHLPVNMQTLAAAAAAVPAPGTPAPPRLEDPFAPPEDMDDEMGPEGMEEARTGAVAAAKARVPVEALAPVFLDAAQRVVHKESLAIARAQKRFDKDPAGYRSWAAVFFTEQCGYMKEAFGPALVAAGTSSAALDGYLEGWRRAVLDDGRATDPEVLARDVMRIAAPAAQE